MKGGGGGGETARDIRDVWGVLLLRLATDVRQRASRSSERKKNTCFGSTCTYMYSTVQCTVQYMYSTIHVQYNTCTVHTQIGTMKRLQKEALTSGSSHPKYVSINLFYTVPTTSSQPSPPFLTIPLHVVGKTVY